MTPYRESRRYTGKNGEAVELVRWRLEVGIGTKRIRKDFTSQGDALKYARATKTLRTRIGVFAMGKLVAFPDDLLLDLVTAAEEAKRAFPKEGICISQLVRDAAAARTLKPSFAPKKLISVVDEYLLECKSEMDPTWHRTLGGCLRKIATALGDIDMHELTGELLEDTFEEFGWPSKTTWNHHRAYYVTLCKWAAKKTTKKSPYLAGDNPAEAVPVKKKNRDEKEDIWIPPPAYRKKLVETAVLNPQLDLESYLALTFDLGLRTAEAMRLSWADFNGEDKDPDLKVTASKTKSGATRTLSLRHPLLTRVKDVLSRHKQDVGSIIPRNLRERRDELYHLAGLPLIQGVGRRSFATAFYKHTGDDVLTRSILGHLGDAKIFIASYRAADVIDNGSRRRVTSTDAETYFGVPIANQKEKPTVA